jgi:hypothetical protein
MKYIMVQSAKHTVCNTLRYKMPRIPYAISYDRECQAYCMKYTTLQNAKHIKQYTTVQNAKHTVWNTLRYRMPSILSNTLRYRIPSILYAIHYGTECQAYCMKYTTLQNAKDIKQYTTVQNTKHTVVFTTTYAISSGEVYSMQHYVIKFVSDLR